MFDKCDKCHNMFDRPATNVTKCGQNIMRDSTLCLTKLHQIDLQNNWSGNGVLMPGIREGKMDSIHHSGRSIRSADSHRGKHELKLCCEATLCDFHRLHGLQTGASSEAVAVFRTRGSEVSRFQDSSLKVSLHCKHRRTTHSTLWKLGLSF